jgi:pimeloyl-ACP methyl ester carboxylesterase
MVLMLGASVATAQQKAPTAIPELLTPVPLPEQVPAKTGHVKVAGARLWYWDTGGDGPPVVLVHPGTGSGLVWGYQQPVFAKAGYRVIGYSRKNHVHSEITAPEEIGSEVEDLHGLVQFLRLGKFHAVGLAAGGGIVMQYSVSHPKNLLSMTIACSLGSVKDETYYKASAALRPASFYNLPAEVRELGPCYRAANPAGVRRWRELEKKARPQRRFLSGTRGRTEVTWAKLKAEKIPTLLLGGDADLYMPSPMLKYFHDRMPGSKLTIIHGCGHSAYWEQPKIFNRTVMGFLSKHSK